MKGKKIKLEGIILNSYRYGENHKIFQFLTPDQGIISVIAHGAKKYKSKFRGNIETLNVIEGTFYQSGRSEMLVAEDIVLKEYFSPHLTYDLLWIVWPFLKFLTLFHFSDERENEKFFTMFLTLLRTLVKTRDPLHGRLLIYGFALKSLMITSMIQNIRYCYDCSEKISPPAYFEPEKGLVLCGNCRINYYHTLDFSESFYTFLTKIIYSRFEEIIYFITDSPQLENVKNFLDILCTHQLGKRWTNFEPEENPFDHESEIRENPLPQR